MMLSLFLYAEDVYEATRDAQAAWLRSGYRGLSAVRATPVMGLLGGPLARHPAEGSRSPRRKARGPA